MRSTNVRRSYLLSRDFARHFGPAWLVMLADMDVACVIEAAQTGGLVWLWSDLAVPSAHRSPLHRPGTGWKEHRHRERSRGVIRDHHSTGWSLVMALPIAITDLVTYAIEYIGITIGLEIGVVSL
jgi:manganese transport protein